MNGNALKVTGAQIMPGHSGGPLVTNSGTVVGWNFARNNELSWCRPIAEAEKCIRLVLPGAWEQLFASAEAEGAHDRQQQHAADARTAAGLRRMLLLEGDGKRPTAATAAWTLARDRRRLQTRAQPGRRLPSRRCAAARYSTLFAGLGKSRSSGAKTTSAS